MAATGNSEQAAGPVRTEEHTPTPWIVHTPTPWIVCDSPPNDQWIAGLTIFCPAEGKRVADSCFLDSRAKANAAFIVRAVNAHDDLVKALEDANQFFGRPAHMRAGEGPAPNIITYHSAPGQWSDVCESIRAALAKAKGAA